MRKKLSLQDASMNKIIGILFAIISAAFLIGGIILFFTSGETDADNKDEQCPTTSIATVDSVNLPSTVSAKAEVTTQEVTSSAEEITEYESVSENQTEPSEIPHELQTLLIMGNCNSDTLDAANTNQLIVVNSGGTTADISFYERTNEKWIKDENLTCTGFVGSEGTVTYMSEQVSGTPKGFYSIGSAFYQYNTPYTGLSTFKITNDTYWIDDPDSKFYNQRVEGISIHTLRVEGDSNCIQIKAFLHFNFKHRTQNIVFHLKSKWLFIIVYFKITNFYSANTAVKNVCYTFALKKQHSFHIHTLFYSVMFNLCFVIISKIIKTYAVLIFINNS